MHSGGLGRTCRIPFRDEADLGESKLTEVSSIKITPGSQGGKFGFFHIVAFVRIDNGNYFFTSFFAQMRIFGNFFAK